MAVHAVSVAVSSKVTTQRIDNGTLLQRPRSQLKLLRSDRGCDGMVRLSLYLRNVRLMVHLAFDCTPLRAWLVFEQFNVRTSNICCDNYLTVTVI